MKTPLIIVNFKCYEEGTGEKAVKLAKICESVAKEYKINIAVAPQFTDIHSISKEVNIPIFSQHIDSVYPGPYTGHISPLSIKEAGVIGSLINHSEKRLSLEEIEKCIKIARKYDLITVCCSKDINESKEIAKFSPDFIAYEDPTLIGTGQPISKMKPETVKEFVEILANINLNIIPLCGVGISTGEDVKIALELGCKGVLVASAIVKAQKPKVVLENMAKAIK